VTSNIYDRNSIADDPDKGVSGWFDFIEDLNRILLDSVIPLQQENSASV